MKYPAYPKYKDSGVQWLGEVPEHWEIWKLSHGFQNTGSGTTPPSDNEDWYDGDIPWVTTSELRESIIFDTTKKVSEDALITFSALKLFPEGSLAIAMYGATIGRLGILGVPATTNQACCIMYGERALNARFMFLWFQAFREQVILLASGGGQPNISQDKIRSIRVACPPLPEQTAIADFLDRETGRIDTLVAKKRRLIALLGEKRIALISRTLTRGLPAEATREFGLEPHTRFKDSGIEWLGEVPEGWEIVPLRHLILALDQGWSPTADSSPATEDQWGVLKLSAIREGSFAPSDNKALDDLPNGINPLTPNDGDVLISRANTPERVGDACLVKGEHPWRIIPDLIYRLQLDRKKVLPVFVVAFLLSRGGRAQIQADARGSNGSMVKLGQSHLRSWLFPLPSLPEQTAIAAYLDRETATIDQLVAKVEAAIARLLEYRTALITAAVTGKIDVRGKADKQGPTRTDRTDPD